MQSMMSGMSMMHHSPLHILLIAAFLIGIIASTIWLMKADRDVVMKVAIVGLLIALFSGYLMTGSWGTIKRGGEKMDGMCAAGGDCPMMESMDGATTEGAAQ